MSLPSETTVQMRDFPGLNNIGDPRDFAAGAAREQVNLVCLAGKLGVRLGIALLKYEDDGDT